MAHTSDAPKPQRRKTPSARSKARRRAVEILFEADQRGLDPREVARNTQQRLAFRLHPFTWELIDGVSAYRDKLNALINTHSHDWPVDRMPAVDRAIVQVGAYEILSPTWLVPAQEQAPPGQHIEPNASPVPVAVAVVLSEAVALASLLSTESSPMFINAVLDAIARGSDPSGDTTGEGTHSSTGPRSGTTEQE